MPIQSQMRLVQLSGSLDDTVAAVATPATIADKSMQGQLDQVAAAVKRITGGGYYTSQVAGTFSQTIIPEADGTRNLGSATKEWATAHTNAVQSAVALVVSASSGKLSLDGTAGIDIGKQADVAVVVESALFTLDASAGISLDNTAVGVASNLSHVGAAGVDLTIDASASSLILTGGEADAAAVRIQADDAAGGIDVDAGTGGIAIDTLDGGGISIDAIGAPSNFTLTSTAAGDDLIVEVLGNTDSSLVLSSTGTALDALQVVATAGGMDIESALELDITTSGNNSQIKIDPHGSGNLALGSADNTAVTVDALAVTLTSVNALKLTDGTASLVLSGTGAAVLGQCTTIDLDATGLIQINSSAGDIGIGNDAETGDIGIGTAGARLINIGAAENNSKAFIQSGRTSLEMGGSGGQPGTGILALSGGLSTGRLEMSASAIYFSASPPMIGSRFRLANDAQWSTFADNALFGGGTTLVGALNALASAAGGGSAARTTPLTGTVAAGSPGMAINASSGFTNASGFTSTIAFLNGEVNPANTDVFVNGQMLVSSSVAATPATSGDYVVALGNTGKIHFSFELAVDDIVQVRTSAQQS